MTLVKSAPIFPNFYATHRNYEILSNSWLVVPRLSFFFSVRFGTSKNKGENLPFLSMTDRRPGSDFLVL